MAWKSWRVKKNPTSEEEQAVQEPAPNQESAAEEAVSKANENQVENEKTQREEPARTRSVQFKIWLSQEEYEEITRLVVASGKKRTQFIMDAIREHPTVIVEGVPELMVELKKQGVNLNQAMRLANEVHDTRNGEIYEAIKKHGATMAAIMEFMERWDVKTRSLKSKKTLTK